MTQTFVKKSEYFTPEQVQKLFESNQRFYMAAQGIRGLRIPKPLNCSDDTLEFEWMEGLEETFSHSLHKGIYWDEDCFYRIGNCLGQLHASQGNLMEKIFLHGDFVPHNVVLKEGTTIFFDFEPPGTFDDFDHFYRNYNYVDIASFLFFIMISHYFKRPFRFFSNKKPYIQAFLIGYRNGSGFSPSQSELSRYIAAERRKWYRERRHSFPKKALKYAFVCVVLFVQIRVYGVLT